MEIGKPLREIDVVPNDVPAPHPTQPAPSEPTPQEVPVEVPSYA